MNSVAHRGVDRDVKASCGPGAGADVAAPGSAEALSWYCPSVHYRHERKSTSAYLQEKRYLEERTVYDLAFLSAFRAMEALLGTVQIHKPQIPKLLHAFDGKFRTSFCS